MSYGSTNTANLVLKMSLHCSERERVQIIMRLALDQQLLEEQ